MVGSWKCCCTTGRKQPSLTSCEVLGSRGIWSSCEVLPAEAVCTQGTGVEWASMKNSLNPRDTGNNKNEAKRTWKKDV